ncbi:MAG TPA: VOC family protein [Stenotrophomonas sp.]|jgi:predicted enzyme related to lactoylglutathione lyase
MTTAAKFGFIVEYVQDIDASVTFYTQVLGLQVQRRHPTFVQFETFAIASDAPMGGGDRCELYWLVDDIELALGEISARTDVTLPLRELPFGRVFGIRDPDGRERYLLQLAKHRPSVAE